jgi:hypothetical protein
VVAAFSGFEKSFDSGAFLSVGVRLPLKRRVPFKDDTEGL